MKIFSRVEIFKEGDLYVALSPKLTCHRGHRGHREIRVQIAKEKIQYLKNVF